MKSEFSDVNLFREGSVVDIDNISELQGVTITRIADSGVTIKNSGRETVISGKSPACLTRNIIKEIDKKVTDMDNTNTNTENTTEAVAVATEAVSTRGKYKDVLAALKLPNTDTFTIKQVAELNALPIPYAVKWVAENCDEAGLAQKPAGQRGRVAKLYKVKS